MIDNRASVTAMMVALARGFSGAGQKRSRDPHAQGLLPEPFRSSLGVARGVSHGRPIVERAISFATFDMLAHASLRTGEIDAAVDAAIASGITQLVIVGAGLDARAYRLASLAEVRVFEVDHPATQRLKVARTHDLPVLAAELRYVAVDFARDSLDEALQRAGHDPSRPTLFLWEGVTMYLPNDAIRGTLDVMRSRSAAGSRLIVTYCETRMSTIPVSLEPSVKRVFSLVGEPLLGLIDRRPMHALLEEFGFRVLADTWSEEWEQRTTYGERPVARLRERVAVAERLR